MILELLDPCVGHISTRWAITELCGDLNSSGNVGEAAMINSSRIVPLPTGGLGRLISGPCMAVGTEVKPHRRL
jgi:hypothetical protein